MIEIVGFYRQEKHYPDAKCQWCGDTGKFLDTDDQEWDCFDDCPRDREE